jgi:osmotically-inducible protein OsmY
VPGVRAVGNDIAVRTPGVRIHTSAEIARAARCALERDVLVPYERIRTTVTDGWVTLEGQVDRAHQRDDAEWAVRHLAGVRGS